MATFNTEDILARLKNGDDIETIGKELTDALNTANAEYKKQKQEQEKKEAKQSKRREIVARLLNDIKEFALLENIDPGLLDIDENDIEAVTSMLIAAFSSLKHISTSISNSDDKILDDFITKILHL